LLRHRLSIPPARSAVPCLTSTFYLRDLRASAVLGVITTLFAVSVAPVTARPRSLASP
jgi:hypothetical protein